MTSEKIYPVKNMKTRATIRMAVLGYFLSAQILQVGGVLFRRDGLGQLNSNRKLSDNFWRSVSKEPNSPLRNTRANTSVSDESPFSETQVRDKPGIFFPDDINPWTPWSACSSEVQVRTRGPPEYAIQMRCGHLECVETRSCRSVPMIRESQWGGWGQWSECSPIGSRTTRTRARQCVGQSDRTVLTENRSQSNLPTSVICQGQAYEAEPCEVQTKMAVSPEWSNWGQWSTCENGRQFRIRNCKLSNQCIGARFQVQDCFLTAGNSMDRTQGQQFLCSGTSQYRSRYCGGLPSYNGYQRVRESQQRLWNK